MRMKSMHLPMSPQRMEPRRLLRVRCYLLSFFIPVRKSLCPDVNARAAESPNETGPNETPGGVVIESTTVEAVIIEAS
jgi:hypothetical protein